MTEDLALSVVIPSLGGDLCNALDSINAGSVIPDEIIVCLPNESHFVQDASKYKNLRIIYAQRYGQVYQRIVGFKQAKSDYILQLDDDILLDKKCLEYLFASFEELPEDSVISPCWVNADGDSFYGHKKTGVSSFYYWLINGKIGYEPGRVTRAGTSFGVNFNEVEKNIVKVEWQPGGCILHRRKNLVLEDYYQNRGKAYCEDLIHSFLLRKSGVNLFVNTYAKCTTLPNSRLSLFKEIVPDFKARLYFVRMANLSVTRMLLFYIIYMIKNVYLNTVRKNTL